MPLTDHSNPVVDRLNKLLDNLLDSAARRIAPRVADQLEPKLREAREEYEAWMATIETVADPELAADLRKADGEADEDAQDYAQVRRELGLA